MLNILGMIPTALAQDINLTPGEAGDAGFGSLGDITVGGIISTFITVALIIAGIVFLFMLILGGIRWILSGGDKAQTETARNQITAALIGLVVVFSAYAIATLIANIFNVNILSFDVPNIGGGGAESAGETSHPDFP